MAIYKESWYQETLSESGPRTRSGVSAGEGSTRELSAKPRGPGPELPDGSQRARDKFWIADLLLNKILPQLIKGLDEAGNLWGDPEEIVKLRLEIDDFDFRLQEFFASHEPRSGS